MTVKQTQRTATTLVYHFWLVFDSAGSLRLTRKEPAVGRQERAMAMSVTLPRSLFSTPTLKARVTVPEGEAQAIDIDIDTVSDAIKLAIGADIDLVVRREEQPEHE